MYSRIYKLTVTAPPLLWVGLFLLLPYILMFAHSFWLVRDGFLVHEWNLQNYHKLISNPLPRHQPTTEPRRQSRSLNPGRTTRKATAKPDSTTCSQ